MENKPNLYRRIGRLILPHWPFLAVASLCMLVLAGATAGLAWMVKPLLDDIFVSARENPGRAARMIFWLPFLLVVLQAFRGAASYGQEVFMDQVGQKIVTRLREMIYAHLQKLSLSFYDHAPTGVLISRAISDVQLIQESVSRAVAVSFRDIFTILALTGLIFYRDWRMALIAMIVFPLAMLPFIKVGQWVRRLSGRGQQTVAEISDMLQQTITGARIVKAFCAEEQEIGRFNQLTQRLLGLTLKEIKIRALSSPIMELLGAVGLALIVGYGGHQVVTGQSTPGTFFSFMAAIVLLYDPVKKLARANNQFQKGLAASERVFELLDTEPTIVDRPDAREIPPLKNEISFEGVSFSYGREPVLKGIDLKVPAGQILALAGKSGGGKTTLVNLLPRFYEVDSGAVKIDGTDIREATLASLRGQIGLVTQQTILFNDTIRANIAYGRPQASEEEIVAAAKAAFAHDFIVSLPQGYQTLVGEQGVRLSGGQRQRLAIARALLKDAPILILDEATSSLDTESEFFVQKAIDNLMAGRTTLVIAHRLSTIQNADRIVVMVDGKIKEEGRHEDLMALKGEYFRLYQMQFNG